jgi:prepilin-type processing-associated H-X9-DG protein
MDEIKKDNKKPKICDFALFAFLIPILYIIASCCMIYQRHVPAPFKVFLMLCSMVIMLSIVLLPASFISGFIAVIKIALSKRLLKGYIFSILGILLSIWAFDLNGKALNSGRIYSTEVCCQSRIKQLGNMIKDYSQLHNGQYPEPSRWCDLLCDLWKSQNQEKVKRIVANHVADMERGGDAEVVDAIISNEAGFFCPSYFGLLRRKESNYAINPNCKPDSPPDTVLLFETVVGWNKFGGPECVAFNHLILSIIPFNHVKGCNVLFNDGNVELISPKKIGKLKWNDERAK